MQHFAGRTDNIKKLYCDNAPDLVAGARHGKWRLVTSTTGMPQTNGLAERGVRTVKEGGRCRVVQAGFSASWWPIALEHLCFSKVITDVAGDSPYSKRLGRGECRGERISFGALIDFMPQPETRIYNWGGKAITGLFVGYHTHPGSVWSGDYLVADFALLGAKLRCCLWNS